jgi:hypothetical protein
LKVIYQEGYDLEEFIRNVQCGLSGSRAL